MYILSVQVNVIFLLLVTFNFGKCLSNSQSDIQVQHLPINNFMNSLKSLNYETQDVYKLPMFTQSIDRLSLEIDDIREDKCRDHAKLIFNHLQNVTRWAIKFYDASAKFPEGVLGGSTYQFGNFDECLNIGVDNYDNVPLGIHGKYCLGEMTIEVPEFYFIRNDTIWVNFKKKYERYDNTISKLHWGICVPASCSANEIQRVVKRLTDYVFEGTDLIVSPVITNEKCYSKEPLTADVYDIIYIAVILTIVMLIVVSTLFHAICGKNDKQLPQNMFHQISNAFSMISNFKKLCGPGHDSNLNLNCISGIKFLAMVFIIAGHCLVFIIGGPILNMDYWEQAVGKAENAIFLNSPLLVDTFLFLSGLLFARILLHELDKRKSVNFIFLYIFRYIRLTPAYLIIVGLYATWLPKLGSGPLWSRMIEEKARCQTSWWTNIIYINNYINTDKLCMFQSWYLSVDTQLFIIAPAIIYPLWRWRKPGEIILALTTAISVIIPFTVTLVNHLDPTLMIYTSEIEDISINEYFKSTYIKTHMRATPYCFGLVYGYILYRIQTTSYKFSQSSIIIGWILGALSLIASMFSIGLFYGIRKHFTLIEAAFYSSIHRVLWSLGTGWIILACVTDNSGPVGRFLKWQPFVTLSRLTYSAYLVNGLVELHGISTTRTPQYLDTWSLLSKVMSHLMLTFFGAVILSIMFEAPILGLERIFVRPGVKGSDNSSTKRSEETSTIEA
ncbi:hypothetical protein PV326_010087 [Microctonus aethiopoides]|nr:hypothetical protein PV326_010087 [Microctonus aethiopoides]